MRVLITGGAGYIGSHLALRALHDEHQVLVCDDLSNSLYQTVEVLTRRGAQFAEKSIQRRGFMTDLMKKFRPDLVIHTAASKDVAESEQVPLQYYENNVGGTLALLQAMEDSHCDRLIFSSSAAVYGESSEPLTESSPIKPTSAYGKSKMICEDLISDFAQRRNRTAISLRYFNPVGSTSILPAQTVGFMPVLARCALLGQTLPLFNSGQNVRDFVHITDLVNAHFTLGDLHGYHVYNVGSGIGHKTADAVAVMSKISKKEVAFTDIELHRIGDIAHSVADVSGILRATGWKPSGDLESVCWTAFKAEKHRLSSER